MLHIFVVGLLLLGLLAPGQAGAQALECPRGHQVKFKVARFCSQCRARLRPVAIAHPSMRRIPRRVHHKPWPRKKRVEKPARPVMDGTMNPDLDQKVILGFVRQCVRCATPLLHRAPVYGSRAAGKISLCGELDASGRTSAVQVKQSVAGHDWLAEPLRTCFSRQRYTPLRERRVRLCVSFWPQDGGMLVHGPVVVNQSSLPPAGSGASGKPGKGPTVKVERGRGGRKVYRITTGFVIEGRIPFPRYQYLPWPRSMPLRPERAEALPALQQVRKLRQLVRQRNLQLQQLHDRRSSAVLRPGSEGKTAQPQWITRSVDQQALKRLTVAWDQRLGSWQARYQSWRRRALLEALRHPGGDDTTAEVLEVFHSNTSIPRALIRSGVLRQQRQIVSSYRRRLERAESELKLALGKARQALQVALDSRRLNPAETQRTLYTLARVSYQIQHARHLRREQQHQKRIRSFNSHRSGAAAKDRQLELLSADYSSSVRLLRELLRRFPTTHLKAPALYLLGRYLDEMGQHRLGLQAHLSLVCSNRYAPPLGATTRSSPDHPASTKTLGEDLAKPSKASRLYSGCWAVKPAWDSNSEAWLRIGEFHFDRGQPGAAVASYQKVHASPNTHPRLRATALYKLAWSYYLLNRMPEAIEYLDQFVIQMDSGPSRQRVSAWRREAVRYLAIAFAEQDWDGDLKPDAETGLQRIEKFYGHRASQKHVREVYRLLAGRTSHTTTGTRVLKLYLRRWPHHPGNPGVQEQLIEALDRQRKPAEAWAQRQRLVTLFGQGSPWAVHNRTNPRALKKARDLVEQELVEIAVIHHKNGQVAMRKFKGGDQAAYSLVRKEYSLAARAYENFLKQYPGSRHRYDVLYSHAYCLFVTGRQCPTRGGADRACR